MNKLNFEIQLVGNRKDYDVVDLLNQYGIVFGNYNNYIEETKDKDFINFLKHNIEQRVVSDFLKDSNFEVTDFLGFYMDNMEYKAILKDFDDEEEKLEYKLLGSFVLNHTYMIHLVSSYIYIEHIKTKQKWFYYAD